MKPSLLLIKGWVHEPEAIRPTPRLRDPRSPRR